MRNWVGLTNNSSDNSEMVDSENSNSANAIKDLKEPRNTPHPPGNSEACSGDLGSILSSNESGPLVKDTRKRLSLLHKI
jgi:hypothetical protein